MTAGFEQGDLLAAQALDKVEANADPAWLGVAKRVVWQLVREGEPFTTDDCWVRLSALGVTTHEPRALGAVIRAAARAGFIRSTGEYRKTSRPEAHSRPIPVWLPVRKADAA